MQKIEKIIEITRHPRKADALILFKGVQKQLSGKTEKMKDKKYLAEMEKFLKEDHVIDDIRKFSKYKGVVTQLKALENAINKLKAFAA